MTVSKIRTSPPSGPFGLSIAIAIITAVNGVGTALTTNFTSISTALK